MLGLLPNQRLGLRRNQQLDCRLSEQVVRILGTSSLGRTIYGCATMHCCNLDSLGTTCNNEQHYIYTMDNE